jgi:hypothetical protein
MFKILSKLLRKHALLHLVLPLLGGFLAEIGYGYLSPSEPGGSPWKEVLYSRSKIVAAGILVTYFAVMYIETKRETSVRFVDEDLDELRKIMSSASEVFATSTLPMEEWFQPISQVYFSIIVKQRFHRPEFKHERIILFFTQRDFDDVDLPYLDGYYARRLADLHLEYEIPLSFIKSKDLEQILKSLKPETLTALQGSHANVFKYLPVTWWRATTGTRSISRS